MLEGAPEVFVRKAKPLLCRLGAEKIRAYALAHGLPVAEGKSPKSKGATSPYYQEAVEYLDQKMPGTERDFYLSFLRARPDRRRRVLPGLRGIHLRGHLHDLSHAGVQGRVETDQETATGLKRYFVNRLLR
ncbi:hypothetical protein DFAR_2920009 [Desulfarculales bacterium]